MLIIMAVGVALFAPELIRLFRNDNKVVEIGTRAMYLQCASLLFQPLSVVTEMQLQSTGQKIGAALLSSLKSGVYFIPALLILSNIRGLNGIQEAQPLSYILSFVTSAFFAVCFFKRLPEKDSN